MQQVYLEINSLVSITIVSVLLVYPLSFRDTGQVLSVIILFIQGLINYRISKIYLKNMINDKESLDMVVSRVIGRKWGQCYLIISIIYLLQLTLLYSFYTVSMFDQVSSYLFKQIFNAEIISRENFDLSFNNYSYQYSAIMISPLFVYIILTRSYYNTLNLKSITFFLSSFSILSYICYILYIFLTDLPKDTSIFQVNQISFYSIANFMANNNLAYENQQYFHQILKPKKGKISTKSLKYSTIIIFTIYAFVGIFGSFAIQKLKPINPDYNNFVFDYFDEDFLTIIIKGFMVYHFLQNLTYRYLVLRNCLLKFLINPKKTENNYLLKQKMEYLLNIIFSTFFVTINFIKSNLQYKFTIITGSLAGFFIIYLIPYKLRFGRMKQALKLMMRTFNFKYSTLSHSLVQVQEEDSKIYENQKEFLLSFSDNSNQVERKLIKSASKNKGKLHDKLILLFGFFLSIYGMIYFIYFLIGI